MPTSQRKRQQKLQKSRKKRELQKKDTRKREAQFQGASLLRLAQAAPFGPAWVATSLDSSNELGEGGAAEMQMPALITVVVTRKLRGMLLAEVALVDRTCLGVKNAMLLPMMSDLELRDYLSEKFQDTPMDLRECEPLEAQSVVFHALDYAKSLGFLRHPDFYPEIFEPRPEALLDTPLSKPTRPIYVAGPDDSVQVVLNSLIQSVGPDGFDVFSGGGELLPFELPDDIWGESEENDGDGEEEDESADIETSGETVAE